MLASLLRIALSLSRMQLVAEDRDGMQPRRTPDRLVPLLKTEGTVSKWDNGGAAPVELVGPVCALPMYADLDLYWGATRAEIAHLQLDPRGLRDLLGANLRRLFGPPIVKPLPLGFFAVQSSANTFASSYLLDREHWENACAQAGGPIAVIAPNLMELIGVPLHAGTYAPRYLMDSAKTYFEMSDTEDRLCPVPLVFEAGEWRFYASEPGQAAHGPPSTP